MRRWQIWWRDLVFAAQQNPPRMVESVMLGLAAILSVVWVVLPNWQFLILSLGYIFGAIASILVRESVAPSLQTHRIRLTAIFSLALLLSLASFYFNKVFHLVPALPSLNTLSV